MRAAAQQALKHTDGTNAGHQYNHMHCSCPCTVERQAPHWYNAKPQATAQQAPLKAPCCGLRTQAAFHHTPTTSQHRHDLAHLIPPFRGCSCKHAATTILPISEPPAPRTQVPRQASSTWHAITSPQPRLQPAGSRGLHAAAIATFLHLLPCNTHCEHMPHPQLQQQCCLHSQNPNPHSKQLSHHSVRQLSGSCASKLPATRAGSCGGAARRS